MWACLDEYSSDVWDETTTDASLGAMTFPVPVENMVVVEAALTRLLPVWGVRQAGWRRRVVDNAP